MPKYDVKVDLAESGHGMEIIGKVRTQMRDKGISSAEITRFTEEALFGDYTHLLRTCMEWVEVSA